MPSKDSSVLVYWPMMTLVSSTTPDMQQLAEEISRHYNVEIVPGTEILTDPEGSRLAHAGKRDIVLVPQPHDDAHDPLNWSPRWKYTILINTAFYMFLTNFTSLSIAPMTPLLMEEFNTSLTKVAELWTGYCVLALGYANFIIIPCANVFGRRPTAIICSVICIAAHVWQAIAGSYNSLLGGRILVGIGAAVSESFMPLIIADIVFLHERGKWMGIYFWAFFMGAWLGPVIAGTIAGHISWRWFFWLAAILQINCIALIFFFPETKYRRENSLPDLHRAADPVETTEQISPPRKDEKTAEVNDIEQRSVTSDISQTENVNRNNFIGIGYPSRNQRWNVWFKVDRVGLKMLPRDLLTPIYISILPIVIFAACSLAFPACALLVLNLLESPAFSAPPFNFSPASVGYVNFALMGGGIFGLCTAGPFSDWMSMFLTRTNNGIREPEMRLLSLIPFILIGMIGMVVSALGFEYGWPWPVIVVIGFGFTGTMVMAIPAIGITYAIDSYKPIAGEIMVVATVWKNTFAYGMVFYINNWAVRSGYIPPIMMLMALSTGVPLLGIPIFWYFGKSCRRLTRRSKLHSY